MDAIQTLALILTQDSIYKYEPLNGLTNEVFLVIVEKLGEGVDVKYKFHEHFNGKPYLKFIFRVYGAASDFINRNMEIAVLTKLGNSGICPKIYYGEDKFRMEEYMENFTNSTNQFLNSNLDLIFEKMMDLNCSDLIDYTYEDGYLKMKHRGSAGIIEISEDGMISTPTDFLKLYLEKLATPALDKIKTVRELSQLEKDDKSVEKLDKIIVFMSNFDKIMNELFEDKEVLALTHHDLHKLNIMKDESEKHSIFLDFEFTKLSPIGLDVVNFLIELSFDYSTSPYKYEKFDIKDNYQKYLQYISKFNKQSCDKTIDGMPYYLKLIRMSCLFWIVIEAFYLKVSYTSFNYLEYMTDRLSILQATYEN